MTERFANNPSSTLNGAINNAVTSLVVTSATGFSTQPNFRLLIDSEYLLVTAVAGSTFTVTRGIEGSTAASHSNGATVIQLLTAGGLVQQMTDHTALTDPHQGKYPTLTTVTTKGDLMPATGSAAVGRLAAGADNLPVVADTTQTTGLRYGGTVGGTTFAPSGLSGAVQASRYVGATTSGAPISGTFVVGDYVIAQNGTIWICTVAGSPGTWVNPGVTGPTGATGAQGSAGPPGPPSTVAAALYVNVQDQKSVGTNGGTFTSGAWQTRTLNTFVVNDANLAGLTANQILLPSGSYRCSISCPAYLVVSHQARLQSITTATTLLTGTSEVANAGVNISNKSLITGRFSIAATTTLEVQHRCSTTGTTQGFGVAASFGTEVYTVAEFWLEGLPPPVSNGMVPVQPNPEIEYTRRRSRSAWMAM